MKFVPPVTKDFRYAVWVEGRGFKVKAGLGEAKQSAYAMAGVYGVSFGESKTHRRIVLAEMIKGDWYTLFDVPAGTAYKDLPWVKKVRPYRYGSGREYYAGRPMTREEYAEWRIRVERERWEEERREPPRTFATGGVTGYLSGYEG